MAGRYENTITSQIYDRKQKKLKRKYSTTIYTKIPEKNSDMYFVAQSGDRLDSLAFRFYNDSELWTYIARANNLKTMNVPPGTSLRIPQLVL